MAYNIKIFKSTHSIFTNFETDHLNWHSDLQNYFHSKIRLLENTIGISCINEQILLRAREFGITIPKMIPNIRIFGKNINLKDRTNGMDIIISGRKKYFLYETQFSGIHNAMNILSSTLILNALKICSKHTREYLRNIT